MNPEAIQKLLSEIEQIDPNPNRITFWQLVREVGTTPKIPPSDNRHELWIILCESKPRITVRIIEIHGVLSVYDSVFYFEGSEMNKKEKNQVSWHNQTAVRAILIKARSSLISSRPTAFL